MDVELRFFGYRYFPYELELARREVEVLTGVAPLSLENGLRVAGARADPAFARRLTYFREVVWGDGTRDIPQQARLERGLATGDELSGARRQNTRYSAHGIHEYKGKFNPQIVRALSNLLALDDEARVWDPFCGSGTVLLESLHDGRHALGTDLNPLGVLIANAKLDGLRAEPAVLSRAARKFCATLREAEGTLGRDSVSPKEAEQWLGAGWLELLPNHSYLAEWFPLGVLAQLGLALRAVDGLPVALRRLFRVFISNVVRECSYQEPADLRIRRRREPASNYPALEMLCTHVDEQIARILAAREVIGSPRGTQLAVEGDCTRPGSWPEPARDFLRQGVDCVITSPPYATALPYIDTQRLSLALLGLGTPRQIRQLDAELVGSRELRRSERTRLEEELRASTHGLPATVTRLCGALLEAANPESDGFRRLNTPTLVFRYFLGMKSALQGAAQALRKGGHVAIVVGPNQTVLGGESFVVDTPSLLADVGQVVGLNLRELIELQPYHRYSMHQRNSIREERVVLLRK